MQKDPQLSIASKDSNWVSLPHKAELALWTSISSAGYNVRMPYWGSSSYWIQFLANEPEKASENKPSTEPYQS